MYELVNIDEYNKGYKIEWKELKKILDEMSRRKMGKRMVSRLAL